MDILVSDATQDIWVDDNQTTKLMEFDANGTRHLEWDLHKGTPALPGLFYELHQIASIPTARSTASTTCTPDPEVPSESRAPTSRS